MTDETVLAIVLYIRLVSYPIATVGVLWLMISRPGWRTRPTSLIWLSLAGLHIAQFAVVVIRAVAGDAAAIVGQDLLITPAAAIYTICLWTAIIWLSRRWRHEPDRWT